MSHISTIKHTGSADVLEALGINVELTAEQVADCIETTGVGFMFAPVVHPAMKASLNIQHSLIPLTYSLTNRLYVYFPPCLTQKVAPVRKALGVRTAFNIVGPLLNAAGAQHVVVGVFQEVGR